MCYETDKKYLKKKPNANFHYRVNFKKNEKAYNSAGSEVLKALKESENDPPEPGKIYLFYIYVYVEIPTLLIVYLLIIF